MGKHLGFLIAAAATGPGGVVLLVMSFFFRIMFLSVPPELSPMINAFIFGFLIAGIIVVITAGVLLLIGLIMYYNENKK